MKQKQWTPTEIKVLRAKLNYSQLDLALKLGYRNYLLISLWENNKKKPNQRAKKLLDLLDNGSF